MTTLHYFTDRQRELAEQNHHIVEGYLRMRGLDINEFYDVVIFGYLQAIQIYDEQPELQKYKFRTIANIRMRAALSNHFRAQRRQKRSAVVYDFDALQEAVAEPLSHLPPQDYAEAREQWAELQPKITPKQMQALRLRADGYSCREVGEIIHIAPGAVSNRIYRLRGKMRQLTEFAA